MKNGISFLFLIGLLAATILFTGCTQTTADKYTLVVDYPYKWTGTWGTTDSQVSIDGNQMNGNDNGWITLGTETPPISVVIQKYGGNSETLKVKILRNGQLVKQGSTSAANGIVSLTIDGSESVIATPTVRTTLQPETLSDTPQTPSITPTETPLVGPFVDTFSKNETFVTYQPHHTGIDYTIKITDVKLKDSVTVNSQKWISDNTNGKFLLLGVEFKNYNNYKLNAPNSFMIHTKNSIIDSESLFDAKIDSFGNSFPYHLVDPGQTISGYFIFDVPSSFDLNQSYLAYNGDNNDGASATWRFF